MFIQLFLTFLLTQSVFGGKPNFLFIIIDDLRPTLGCYGDKNAHTPNIDSLAEKSVLFTRAFAQQSLCAPSRNSLLTSRRPDTLQLYDFYNYWRTKIGNFTTLPQHLKNNGYTTMSVGKVFHPGKSSNGTDDSPYSWTKKPFHPYTDKFKEAKVCRETRNSKPAKNLVCPVQLSVQPNGTLPDIESLNAAKIFVKSHKNNENPFFLAVGFQKPHIPLKYPEKYLKFHPINKFSIPNNYFWPDNMSAVSYNPWSDLRKREDVKALHLKFPWEKIPNDFAVRIIQSYYAAVTYIDHLIGELLDQLQNSQHGKNTIIVLTSDHGWSLGEHSEWAKYSNFDIALRVPLMIYIPSILKTKKLLKTPGNLNGSRKNLISTKIKSEPRLSGWLKKKNCRKVKELVELVDLFPTIAELAELPIKICSEADEKLKIQLCSEGLSLLPLLTAVQQCEIIPWKKAVFSQYPRPGIEPTLNPNSDEPRLEQITIMGYTLRTKKFRYTAWIPFSSVEIKPNWDTILAEELYDHSVDPGENKNQVFSRKFSKIKKELKKALKKGWRNSLPMKK